jgi:hypothetical protein
MKTLKDVFVMEESSVLKNKINLMGVQEDIRSITSSYIRQILEKLSFIQNGFKYDNCYNPVMHGTASDTEPDQETIKRALAIAAESAVHQLKRANREIADALNAVGGTDEVEEKTIVVSTADGDGENAPGLLNALKRFM